MFTNKKQERGWRSLSHPHHLLVPEDNVIVVKVIVIVIESVIVGVFVERFVTHGREVVHDSPRQNLNPLRSSLLSGDSNHLGLHLFPLCVVFFLTSLIGTILVLSNMRGRFMSHSLSLELITSISTAPTQHFWQSVQDSMDSLFLVFICLSFVLCSPLRHK